MLEPSKLGIVVPHCIVLREKELSLCCQRATYGQLDKSKERPRNRLSHFEAFFQLWTVACVCLMPCRKHIINRNERCLDALTKFRGEIAQSVNLFSFISEPLEQKLRDDVLGKKWL